MTPLEQIESWAAGKNIHNTESNECCPDFACCQPDNHFSPELRAKFLQAYRAGDEATIDRMLLMSISGVLATVTLSMNTKEK